MKYLLMLCTALVLSITATPARAGVYGDDLAKCLVSSTSDADKGLLMRWLFSAIALNKEVSGYVDIPDDVRVKINHDTADLYMRLLTDKCRLQTHDAVKYEGAVAIQGAFEVLGRVASQGLFSDPAVAAGTKEMTDLLDEEKLKQVVDGK